jgi:hypothetical protein
MSFEGILDILSAAAIGFAPIFLHIVDKLLERVSPFSEEYIQSALAADPSPHVSRVGRRGTEFRRIRTYFYFEREFHFIVSIVIFNVLSLYITQVECTRSWLQARAPTFIGIVALLLFLIAFLWRTLNGDFSPAAANPTQRWQRAAFAAFFVVMAVEVGFHQSIWPELRPSCIAEAAEAAHPH